MEIALIHKDSTEYEILPNTPQQKGIIIYDTEEHTPEWYYYSSDTMILEVTGKTDAGIYTAYFTPKTGYRWADLTTKKISVHWEISAQEIIALPQQINIPYYDTQKHTPEWINRQEDKLKISVTAQTNPGNYTATFTPTKNYKWSPNIVEDERVGYQISWRINKRIIDEPSLTANSFPYTGSYYDISTMIVGQNSYMTRTGSVKQKAKGKYWLTFKIDTKLCQWKNTDGDTYKLLWTIGYTIVPIPKAAVISFPYDTHEHTLTITGETEYCTRHGILAMINAGKYDVWYVLTDKDSLVWEDDTITDKYIHWEITPRALLKPYLKSTIDPNFGYDGTEKEIKQSDIIGYDPVTMILVSDTFKATAKGKYLISYVLRDSINYRWATEPYYEEVKILWSIDAKVIKNPTILESDRTLLFTGGLISPTITDEPNPLLVDQIGTISTKDLGEHEVIYTLVYPDEYEWMTKTEDGDVHLPWSITTRYLQKPEISGNDTFSYIQGRTQGPTILHYEDQKSFLKRTGTWKAESTGNYSVTFSLGYEEGVAFSDSTETSVTLSWKISDKIAPSTFAQDGHLYYTGGMLQPAISGYNPLYHYKEGEVEASTVGIHRLFILPKENYSWSDSTKTAIPVYWEIEGRAVPLPKANPDIYDYTGSEVTLILTGEKEGDGYRWFTVTGDKESAPGSYTAKVTLKDPDGCYFVNDIGQVLDIRETEISWQIKLYKHDKPRLAKSVFEYDPNGSVFITGKDQDGNYNYIVGYNPEYMKASGDILQYDKGSYELKIDLDPTQDIVWRDNSKDTVHLPWSITGTLLTQEQSVWQQDENISYDAQEHRAPFSVYNAVYHKYDVDRSQWFATAAGTYHIYVVPTKNYSWSDGTDSERDMVWKINPIKIKTPQISGNNTFSYTPKGSTVKIINDQSRYLAVSGDDIFQTTPRTYSRTYTLMDDNVSFFDTAVRSVTLSWTILADQKIAKPEAVTTTYEFAEGDEISLILREMINEDFVKQTGTDHGTAVGKYTATYVVDSTTSVWINTDGSTDIDPVNIAWEITRKKIPAENSTFSLIQRIVGNGTTQYVQDYLTGYNVKYHTLSGVTYRKDPAQNLVLKIDVKPNYCWSDGTITQKTLTWAVEPPSIDIEVYFDAQYTNRIYSISLSDEDTLETDIYVKTTESVSQISAVSKNASIVTVSTDSGSGKNHIFHLVGCQSGSAIIDFSVTATSKYEGATTSITVGVVISHTVSELTWTQVQEAVQDGKIANITRIGDKIPLVLTGTLGDISVAGDYVAVIIGINHNPTTEHNSNIQFMLQNTSGNDIAIVDDHEEDSAFSYFIDNTQQFIDIEEPYTPVIIIPGGDTVPGGDSISGGVDTLSPEDTTPGGDDTQPGGDDTVPGGEDPTPGGDDTVPSGGDEPSTLIQLTIPKLVAIDPVMNDTKSKITWEFQVEDFDPDLMTYTISYQSSTKRKTTSFTIDDNATNDRVSNYCFDSDGNARPVEIIVYLNDPSKYCWPDNSTGTKSVTTTFIPYKLPFDELVQDITVKYTGKIIHLYRFNSILDTYQYVNTLWIMFQGFYGNNAPLEAYYTEVGTYTVPLTPKRGRQWADGGTDTRNFVITISPRDGQYLDNYTWKDISTFNQSGSLPNIAAVGDLKTVTLTGSVDGVSTSGVYEAVILGFNHDDDPLLTRSVHFGIVKNQAEIAFVDDQEEDSTFSYRTQESRRFVGPDETGSVFAFDLNVCDWSEIANYVKSGMLANLAAIGDSKDINLSGDFSGMYRAVIIDIDHNLSGTLQKSVHFSVQDLSGNDIAFITKNEDPDTDHSYRKYNSKYMTDCDDKVPEIIPTYAFNDYSWEDIKSLVEHGLISNIAAIGDTKSIALSNGLDRTDIAGSYKAIILDINHDIADTTLKNNVHFSIIHNNENNIAFIGSGEDGDIFSYIQYNYTSGQGQIIEDD